MTLPEGMIESKHGRLMRAVKQPMGRWREKIIALCVEDYDLAVAEDRDQGFDRVEWVAEILRGREIPLSNAERETLMRA